MPEVQALAERIEERLDGACLVRATALSFSALKTVSPPPDELEGRPLRAVGRRGKFLVLSLDSLRLLIHLSQGGRIVFEEGSVTSRPKGAVLRVRFDRDPGLPRSQNPAFFISGIKMGSQFENEAWAWRAQAKYLLTDERLTILRRLPEPD